MLADEEVAVVEGGGGEADEELIWAGGGDGGGVELEAGVELEIFLEDGEVVVRDESSRVVDLAGLALDLLYCECVRHCESMRAVVV